MPKGKRALPATEPSEQQCLNAPILCEETRAKLEEFRSLGWIPPNFKPNTLKAIGVAERYWRRYCNHLKVNYRDHLLKEEPAVYMNFIDWIYKSTTRKKKLQSYQQYWNSLSQYFSLFSHRPISDHVLQQVARFLGQRFPAEHGVSRSVKRKETLTLEEYGLFQRYLWVYSFYFCCGNMLVQQSVVMLWSSITGTRPGVLLPPSGGDAEPPTTSPPHSKRRKLNQTFESDIPKYLSVNAPKTVCWEDIELMYLRNSDEGRDVLCAIINFRNLKGRPEGADGTRFFMHCDYQLAYCPILHIVAMAFRDKAFENERLTPDLIWRLKVPKRLPSLPLKWKDDKLKLPVLRRMEHTASGFEVNPSLPMTYDSSNMGLKHIGEGLGYENSITHYFFRRWAANAVNQNYVKSERMRILGQSGDQVFERHYQDDFIGGLQCVVLLRPSQESLLREARKARNRDPLAPTKLDDNQLNVISRDPRVLELRGERLELTRKMRSLAGTVEAAKDLYPEVYQQYQEVCNMQQKVRRTLRQTTKQRIRKEYYNTMPTAEVDKQIDQLLSNPDGYRSDSEEEDVIPPIPEYVFEERARIVNAFYGPEAETLEGEEALARRIQVTKDMVALYRLSEPSRRGKRPSSTMKDDSDDEPKQEADSNPGLDEMSCPTNICIVCQRKFPRIDSVRRHLINQHLNRLAEGTSLHCTQQNCNNEKAFTKARCFLWHAATVHRYDLKIGTKVLDRLFPVSPTEEPLVQQQMWLMPLEV